MTTLSTIAALASEMLWICSSSFLRSASSVETWDQAFLDSEKTVSKGLKIELGHGLDVVVNSLYKLVHLSPHSFPFK